MPVVEFGSSFVIALQSTSAKSIVEFRRGADGACNYILGDGITPEQALQAIADHLAPPVPR